MEIGASVLPHFPKDTTDRNRTSPFAFTGNKFEFRMLGSSSSISDSNIVLNTIVAEVLSQFADRLENAGDFKSELSSLIKETIKKHKRILFNGNNYSEEWVEEAAKRGLLNLKSTVDALPYFISEKNIKLFTKHNIFSESEIHSRYEVMLEGYAKVIHIEALTMVDMVKREIIPSVMGYLKDLSETACSKKSLNAQINCELEEKLIEKLSNLSACLYRNIEKLENSILEVKNQDTSLSTAKYYREMVFINIQSVRSTVDELETLVGKEYWAYPTYGELLYSVY
jgi:glutamine synthetase